MDESLVKVLCRARELLEKLVAKVAKLWAGERLSQWAQLVGDESKNVSDDTNKTGKLVGEASLGQLEEEACSVVAFGQGSQVEDSASQVTKIDAGERVGSSSVASNGDNSRVHAVVLESIKHGSGEVV